jgi:hypothetical protein
MSHHEFQLLPFTAESQSKRGAKKGGTRMDFPQSVWYELCERFLSSETKFKSQVAFLRSDESGPLVNEKHQMCFSRALNKYKDGSLQNARSKRNRQRKWGRQEQRLVEYLQLRHKLREYNDPTQVTAVEVRDLVASWETKPTDFVVTVGWVHSVMKKFQETMVDSSVRGAEATPAAMAPTATNSPSIDVPVGPTISSSSHAMAVLQQVKVYCEGRGMPAPIVGLADALMHQIDALPGGKKRGRPMGSFQNKDHKRKDDEDDDDGEDDDDNGDAKYQRNISAGVRV